MNKKILFFLHGWVGKYIIDKNQNIYDFYKPLIEELNKKFFCEFIILPGFSNNPEPERPYFLDDYVNFVNNYIEEKGINKFYLMGHSFGGQIAAKFSYLYPERVEKLILYNSACIRKSNFKRKIFKKLNKIFNKIKIFKKSLFLKKIIYKILTNTTSIAFYSEIMKKTMSNIIEEDLTNILDKIENETIIIWGAKDKITPLWQGKLINSLIRNSKLIVHPLGDHNFHKYFSEFISQNID